MYLLDIKTRLLGTHKNILKNEVFSLKSAKQGRRFFRTGPLLYHKLENMVIFRSGNL